MRKIITGSLAILSLSLSIGLTGCSSPEPVSEDIPFVRSQTVNLEQTADGASYSGEVRGRYEKQLAFQVSGKILKRNVEVGSTVHRGEVLLTVDPKDIAEALNMASAQVASTQSQLQFVEANLNRYRQLFEQGAIGRVELDQMQNTYDMALAAFRQASAQHAQGVNQLGYTNLLAEESGVVANLQAEVGQVVQAGQPILTLVQNGEREVAISVPENRIESLRGAPSVQVRFWALPGVTAEGRVREISPVADPMTRTYKVRISLVNPPAELSLGMTAKAAVLQPGAKQGVWIPLSAIYQTGDTPAVWIVREGSVHLQSIQVGRFGDDQVEVVEGLQPGDVIVTAGVHKLTEGKKVRL